MTMTTTTEISADLAENEYCLPIEGDFSPKSITLPRCPESGGNGADLGQVQQGILVLTKLRGGVNI